MDNRGRLSGLQLLEKKMSEQLSRCPEGLHDGIYDLLFQLKVLLTLQQTGRLAAAAAYLL